MQTGTETCGLVIHVSVVSIFSCIMWENCSSINFFRITVLVIGIWPFSESLVHVQWATLICDCVLWLQVIWIYLCGSEFAWVHILGVVGIVCLMFVSRASHARMCRIDCIHCLYACVLTEHVFGVISSDCYLSAFFVYWFVTLYVIPCSLWEGRELTFSKTVLSNVRVCVAFQWSCVYTNRSLRMPYYIHVGHCCIGRHWCHVICCNSISLCAHSVRIVSMHVWTCIIHTIYMYLVFCVRDNNRKLDE